ncbi:MAG: S16 family serine protease [Candidatus Zixiibacteriota bacterium]
MRSISDLESSARHLRACSQRTQGLHFLLCGIEFFSKLALEDSGGTAWGFVEASLREFAPDIATAARSSPPGDLLPDEINKLEQFIALAESKSGIVFPQDVADLKSHLQQARSSRTVVPPAAADDQIVLAGLFVEYNPELRLAPRGQLLWLRVECERRRRQKAVDQVIVRNQTTKPDDELRRQADLAVQLAREYLVSRRLLNPKKRFRVDYEIEGAASSLTGPSLGLAFAVGAVLSIARHEILRDSLSVPADVAFSGALSEDGRIVPIDGEGLRLKLTRAIHSGLRHVVVPRAHVTEAWEFVQRESPKGADPTLNLVAADDLATVLNDRNLVFPQRRPRTVYQVLRFRRQLQQPRVGIPIRVTLIGVMGFLGWPYLQTILDRNPVELVRTKRGFRVENQYGRELWSKEFVGDSVAPHGDNWKIDDLDGDGRNEVLYAPMIPQGSPELNWVFCYESDGTQRFRRYCPIIGEYPGDSGGVYYDFEHLSIPRVAGIPVIVTEVAASSPGRSHIRLWNSQGDSLGWYVNAGGSKFSLAEDLNGDGKEELLFHCYFHPLGGTSVLALSVDSTYGCSPPYDSANYDRRGVTRGRQYAYTFLPSSELARIDIPSGYSQPFEVRRSATQEIAVYNNESAKERYACTIFFLDFGLQVKKVSYTEQFNTRYSLLIDSTDDLNACIERESERVGSAVLYWTQDGWVKRVTQF